MKRKVLLAASVALLSLALGPARAEFHGFCTPLSSANAFVRLTASGSMLTYTGTVSCGGASELAITSLALIPRTPPGPTQSAPPAQCSNCSTLTASGTGQATPGTYEVRMLFRVVARGATVSSMRLQRWLYLGAGGPIGYCPSICDPAV